MESLGNTVLTQLSDTQKPDNFAKIGQKCPIFRLKFGKPYESDTFKGKIGQNL